MSDSTESTERDREHEKTTRWTFFFFISTIGIGLLMALWMLISSTFF